MTTARESHVAVRLRNGRVLIVGGHQGRRADMRLFASAEEYDPVTRRFTAVGDMQVRRHKHDAVLMADGRVLVTGGLTNAMIVVSTTTPNDMTPPHSASHG